MTSIPPFHQSSGIARRRFLKLTAGTGALLATAGTWLTQRAWPFAQSPTDIRKFLPESTLPVPGGPPNALGQYLPVLNKGSMAFPGPAPDVYHIGATGFQQQMHPDLTGPTTFWGYYDLAPAPGAQGGGDRKYLGGVILARRGTPVLTNVTNQLPATPVVPIDPTIMAGPTETVGQLPKNAITAHVHGGDTPWISDGTPFTWFDPLGDHGVSFTNVPGTNPPTGTATYYYPMNQSARFIWYHDHAIGITRTNVYSGLASAILLTDNFEQMELLTSQGGQPPLLPPFPGTVLVIQDKTFVSPTIQAQDPTWPPPTGGVATPGSLWYPHIYEPNQTGGTGPNPSCAPNPKGRWDYGPCAVTVDPATPDSVLDPADYTLPPTSVVAEAFFDTSLVNGGVYPVLHVAPQRVRFRILNAAQARFYHLNIYPESPAGSGEVATTTLGGGGPTRRGEVVAAPVVIPTVPAPGSLPAMYQIGTEGGFLPRVVQLPNGTPIPLDLATDPTGNTAFPSGEPFNLLLAPAERADLIVDFAGFAGSTFILYNDSPGPFPGGDARNDYFTGDPDFSATGPNGDMGGAPSTQQGFGPNTRTVMKIVVDQPGSDSETTAAWLGRIGPLLAQNFSSNPPTATTVIGQQPALLYNNGNPSQPGPPLPGNQSPGDQIAANLGVNLRKLTLNEDFDEFGRLIQTLGTFTESTNNQGLPTWGQPYVAPATETPAAGSTEVWDLYNVTADTHPIHFHLVNVQVIQRQLFTGDPTTGITLDPAGPFLPDANEIGWKDTVRMNPGEVTTVIMEFKLPTLLGGAALPFTVPVSPRTGGHEYVWHCHILEHEEHDMMRPMIVMAPPA